MNNDKILLNKNINFENTILNTNYCFLRSDNGSNIFFIEDKCPDPEANVILLSPYGESSHSLFLISYYLKSNNLNVIRFDGINNVGLSAGSIINFRLSQIENDLDRIINVIDNNLPIIVIAFSITAPIAFKCIIKNERVEKVVSVVGVIDMTETVEKLSKRSVGCYKAKESDLDPFVTIFGHNVNAQEFVDDMCINNYENVNDTIGYLKACSKPVNFIVAEQDEYVDIDTFERCKKHLNDNCLVKTYPGAGHEMSRSVTLIKMLASDIVFFSKNSGPESEINVPKLTEVVRSSSLESSQLLLCSEYVRGL